MLMTCVMHWKASSKHSITYGFFYVKNKNSVVSAFIAPGVTRATTSLSVTDSRREFVTSAATAAIFAGVPAANAIRDYENVGYLGGGDKIDINNANVRVYTKFPGMYPTIGGKIASGG